MQRLVNRIPALFAPFTVTFKWNEEKLEKDINQELKKKLEEVEGLLLKKEIQNVNINFDGLKKEIVGIKNEIQRQNSANGGLKKDFVENKKEQADEGLWSSLFIIILCYFIFI